MTRRLPYRVLLERYLTDATQGRVTAVAAAAMADIELAEQVLALNGFAVVSAETAAEMDRIERLGFQVPLRELQRVIYAVRAAGPCGECWPDVEEMA